MAETKIPIAAGKAAALTSYLAQGGERVSKGKSSRPGFRYTSGPMKGKTREQAVAAFEQKWAGASGKIKDKYARRESQDGALAPREKYALAADFKPNEPMPSSGNAGLNPDPVVGQSSGIFKRNQTTQEKRMAQHGHKFDKNGNAVKVDDPAPNPNPKNPAPTGGKGEQKEDAMPSAPKKPVAPIVEPEPGSDEARALALAESQKDEMYATADAGGGASMAASQSMYKRNQAREDAKRKGIATDEEIAPVKDKEAKDHAAAVAKREAEIKAAKEAENAKTRERAGLSPESPTTPAPAVPTGPFTPQVSKAIAGANGDLSKMSTDVRQAYQGVAGTPATKAPRSATEPSSVAGTAKPPTAPASNLRPPSDFEAGPGKEWTGIKDGRKTYTAAKELYGEAPRAADATPAGGVGPVRPERTMNDIRGDYQTRARDHIASRTAPRAAPRAIPAIKPVRMEDKIDSVNNPFSQANRDKAQAAGKAEWAARNKDPNMSVAKPGDPDFGKKLSDGEMDQVNAGLQPTGRVFPLGRPDLARYPKGYTPPDKGRVVSTRKATPEELRTRKVL